MNNKKTDCVNLGKVNEWQTTNENNLSFVHPADTAKSIENLPLPEQLHILQNLSVYNAAHVLAELDEIIAVEILETLDSERAACIITKMSPDDATDVLDKLNVEYRNTLLNKLDKKSSDRLQHLLSFDPDSAAGAMTTEIILIPEHITVDEAIQQIRAEMKDIENPYYAYIVDEKDVLVGILSLRDLMLSKPGSIIKEYLENKSVISVLFDVPKEDVANMLSLYNFMAIPVVDNSGHIMGIVTHDDILDIIHDEASADMLGMVGADPDENIYTPWLESVKKRLPWLMVNFSNSALSASVVYLFEGSIVQMSVLAVLMPMIANQGGNTGQQALAVMIRQLATEKFDKKKMLMAISRESKIGLTTGSIMAIVAFFGAWAFTSNIALALIMGLALLCDMVLGAVFGGFIPLFLRWLGRDPAQASSIFLTAITDGAGFFIFLGLVTLFLL